MNYSFLLKSGRYNEEALQNPEQVVGYLIRNRNDGNCVCSSAI